MNETPRSTGWRRAGLLAALVAVLALGLAACYPGGPESLGELGVVVTLKNPDGNFDGMKSYAMEDTVVALTKPGDNESDPINPVYNPTILASLQAEMEAAGFEREMDPETNKPDVWLSVGAVESEVWYYYYDWGYWGGYPGWGYYYPPYLQTGSFRKGTIIWQMHDLRSVEDPSDPEAQPDLNWVGALNGALEGATGTIEAGIQTGIKQAFTQSPYIVGHAAN
jgi:hypothetical protein